MVVDNKHLPLFTAFQPLNAAVHYSLTTLLVLRGYANRLPAWLFVYLVYGFNVLNNRYL